MRADQTATPSADGTFEALSAESFNERIEVTTDDDLVAKVETAGAGDVVVLSSGVHEIDESLAFDGTFSLRGQGIRTTEIRGTGDFPLLEIVDDDLHSGLRMNTIAELRFTRSTGDEPLVFASRIHDTRLFNCYFECEETTGSGLYAEGCWDWVLMGCRFSRPGDPSNETVGSSAGFYAAKTEDDVNTNCFHFTDCRFEVLTSHAMYSDNSAVEGHPRNGRMFVNNCKFHAANSNLEDEIVEKYVIDGIWTEFYMTNSRFVWGHQGFFRNQSGGNNTYITNCRFWTYGDAAIELHSSGNIVRGNGFGNYKEGFNGWAIDVGESASNTLLGHNQVGFGGGIRTRGPRTSVVGNSLKGTNGDGIVCAATGQIIGNQVGPGTGGPAGDRSGHGIVVDGATVTLNANAVRAMKGDGITLTDVEAASLQGNLITGVGGRPVRSAGESDALVLLGNVARDNGTGGPELAGADNDVEHNRFGL